MMRFSFFARIVFCLSLILFVSACGASAAATEAPAAPAAEQPIEAPEMPVEEVQPTQNVQGEVVATQPVVAFSTSTALPNTGGPGGHPTQEPTAIPSIPERRRLTLEFPPQIRAGDSDRVRLTLEVDELGNLTPTAEFEGNVLTGEVIEIPNLYNSHQVTAEARFDIAGVEVRPEDLISEPLTPGISATFYWSIRIQEPGLYRGTIWLYLRFVDKISGEESRKTVSAQVVDIEAVNLLGLSGNFARSFGVLGSIAGTVIGFPFLEDIVKFLFKKRNRGKIK